MRRLAATALLALLAAPIAAQEKPRDAPAPPPGETAPPVQAPPSGPEKVIARRLGDVVAVREGPKAVERVLYFFNPTAELMEGDQLEQGSGGHSEILLNGGAIVTLHASNHVIIDTLSVDGDRLELPLVTQLEAHVLERSLLIFLPGEFTATALNTDITVVLELGRLRVRNEGGNPVVVTGDMRPTRGDGTPAEDGRVELGKGEEIRLVLVGGEVEEAGTLTDLWGAVAVRHDTDVDLAADGATLRPRAAEGQAPEACRLTVRGVRTVPRSGLVVRNPLHVPLAPRPLAPTVPEPAKAPEPAAEPAPPPPADQDQTPPPADEGPKDDGSSGGGSR